VDEAIQWLSYTFLFVRMRKNPLVYGIDATERLVAEGMGDKRAEGVLC
jgi:hypothetical protein